MAILLRLVVAIILSFIASLLGMMVATLFVFEMLDWWWVSGDQSKLSDEEKKRLCVAFFCTVNVIVYNGVRVMFSVFGNVVVIATYLRCNIDHLMEEAIDSRMRAIYMVIGWLMAAQIDVVLISLEMVDYENYGRVRVQLMLVTVVLKAFEAIVWQRLVRELKKPDESLITQLNYLIDYRDWHHEQAALHEIQAAWFSKNIITLLQKIIDGEKLIKTSGKKTKSKWNQIIEKIDTEPDQTKSSEETIDGETKETKLSEENIASETCQINSPEKSIVPEGGQSNSPDETIEVVWQQTEEFSDGESYVTDDETWYETYTY